MSSRLWILNNIPFAIPFKVCVSIFQHFVMNDMGPLGVYGVTISSLVVGELNGRERVQVRRGMVSQDAFDRFREVDLKAPIEIAFVDQFWQEEYVVFFYPFHILYFRLSDFCFSFFLEGVLKWSLQRILLVVV